MSGAAAILPRGAILLRPNPPRAPRVAIGATRLHSPIVSGGPSGNEKFGLPERARPGHPVLALRTALDRYEAGRSARSLDVAFAAAARGGGRPARRARERAARRERAAESVRASCPTTSGWSRSRCPRPSARCEAAGARLWAWFGLESDAAALERGGAGAGAAARGVRVRAARRAGRAVAGAAAAQAGGGPVGRRCSSAELRRADEDLWRRVLGERYESVWRRFAPRGRWRTRELADLIPRRRRGRRRCSVSCRAGWPRAATSSACPPRSRRRSCRAGPRTGWRSGRHQGVALDTVGGASDPMGGWARRRAGGRLRWSITFGRRPA